MPEAAFKETPKARLIRLRKERGLCYRCGKRPPEGGVQICKQCSVKWRERRRLYKARYNSAHRGKRLQLKREAFDAYGGSHCACCGESHHEFLALDHIEGGGAAHRRELRRVRGSAFYEWLKKEGFPRGYQVLCHNCNLAKKDAGICPHRQVQRTELK